ncbi:MAG: hypothetical protein AAGH89_10645 [Verrucomicrobiota bacterium]
MNRLFVALLVFLGASVAQAEDEFHLFTNTKGQEMEAKIVDVKSGKVTIERRDGRSFMVDATMFVAADQEMIAAWAAAPKSTAPMATSDVAMESMNETLGHPIFADAHLWDDVPEDVAGRLKWRRESKTEFVSSFRNYPRPDFRLLGTRPYSAALYGEGNGVNSISLVFANKGDSVSALGQEDQLEALNDLIEADVATLSEKLTDLLGEGEKQRFGEGSSRQNVLRWDWNDHAFLVFEQENEYVSLEIQPKAFADAGGKSERIKGLEIRKLARSNVEQRENGDVVVSNLPMVDQGPKGYCVPATFERCMRYLGIPADMYLLAMAGETAMGGGTSGQALMDAVGSDIRRKGRGFDTFRMDEMEFRKLAKYIDEGIPVMWGMYSTKPFNQLANETTKRRKEVEDWGAYAATLETEMESRELAVDRDTAHITLIIGYNEETNEIAFSDSWGERYTERWVPAEDAADISQGAFYVVTF